MNSGEVVLLVLGVTMLWFLVLREMRWRKRLKSWLPAQGTLVRFGEDGEGIENMPIIRYTFRGEEREQVCEYNLYNDPLGSDVPIVICPDNGEIFISNKRSRWTLTVTLLLVIVFLAFLFYVSRVS